MDDNIYFYVSAAVVSFFCGGLASYWYWHYLYSRRLLRELLLTMASYEARAGVPMTIKERAVAHVVADYILPTRYQHSKGEDLHR